MQGAIGPAGSVNSSVNEMAQWLRLQLLGGEVDGKKLVSPEVLKEIHLPRNFITDAFRPSYPEFTDLHYGMGWMVSYYQGTKIVFHNGGIDGFITHVSFLPEKNLAVVAFANNGSFNSRALALKAYDTLLDFPTKDWVAVMNPKSPAPPPLPATKPLERPGQDYVGTYFHPGYGEITIGEEDGSITIKFTVFDSKLIHLGQGQFINEGLRENFPISFEFDSSGAASQLLWLLEPSLGKAIVFDRL